MAQAGGGQPEGGQRAQAVPQEFQEDQHVCWLLKSDNTRDHDWEEKLQKDIERYNIDRVEGSRLKDLPREYEGTPFVTGTNRECMMLYDGVIVRRCEALIKKAKGTLKKNDLMLMMDSVKELLRYAKTKRLAVKRAGGKPLPAPKHFEEPIKLTK